MHASGGEFGSDFAPENGGDQVAVEAVENAPSLLGIHKTLVERTRIFDSVLNGALGDLVEDDALDLLWLDLQDIGQVP
ncbi:MAG: flagellar basal body rod protein [Parcubacteria group bacterium GW2011_GWA2_53_21]|nr:MAG: flagellar basal body rod protein [Parcubacteria group bacterium GW2011_GWA2_53_21]